MLYATRAPIDLKAIRRNLKAVRERVGGDRLVLAAVKANAYGHGAVRVAEMIEDSGAADWLGVATVDEGVELRRAGIKLPILKFTPTRGKKEIEAALAHDLVLTVVDVDGVAAVAKAAKRQRRDKVKVHLKVDTGMRRVGCTPEEAPGLAQLIDDAKFLRLDGLYSHLPVSDVDAGREFTASQIELFARVVAAVEAARGPVPLKHLANSGGVLGHPESWLDMVRPGLMIYGHYPDPEAERTVEITPAMRLETKVLFVKRVKQGEAVGYGRTWTAPADTWIATLPVGYGDGYSRLLSNRGRVLIDGASYPIVGRVCMDQTMIDLGPKTRVEVGDEAVLIGRSGDEEITVAEIAELMGTIPYEVTCLITGRVERTF